MNQITQHRPAVWVTQKRTGLDFSDADKLGDILYVTDENIHPADIEAIATVANDVAAAFKPEDKILVVASVTGAVVLGLLLSRLKGKQNSVILLLFDAKTSTYKERKAFL